MAFKIAVVIIGASFAGISTAHSILKEIPQANVVLVNPSDKFYFNIAAPRILAKPDAFKSEQYLLPIEEQFSRYPSTSFSFIQGSARYINTIARTVTVEGTDINYNFLVIASGSSTPSTIGRDSDFVPFKPTGSKNIESYIRAAQGKIADAKSIVIAGAGPVGVEFAGEISDTFAKHKDRKITLISGTRRLLPMLKEAAGDTAEKILKSQGVEILKGHKVRRAVQDRVTGKWAITLQNGEEISGDVYISTIGVIPNSSFIPRGFLSRDGWVQVDAGFRVKETSSGQPLPIFAVGDITTHPGRLAMDVADQVPVLTANLKADILGQGKRLTYSPKQKIAMIVPVGQASGTGEMFGWVLWGKMVRMIKGKDFFVSKAQGFISGK